MTLSANGNRVVSDVEGECVERDVAEVPVMVAVYRHDVHKLRGRSHVAACE